MDFQPNGTPIVPDEFRLFLDRGARQQSPSPFHRHCQNKTIDEFKKGIIIEW
jgi:hypothetical protein